MGHVEGRVIMEAEGIQAALERLSAEIIDSTEDPASLPWWAFIPAAFFLPTG